MKHLQIFNTSNDYNENIGNSPLPNVSYINNSRGIKYKGTPKILYTTTDNRKIEDFVFNDIIKSNEWNEYLQCFVLTFNDNQFYSSIGGDYFKENECLKSLSFIYLNDVTTISADAITYNENLEKITFTGLSNVEKIGNNFLSNNDSLTEIDLSALVNLKSFGNNCFNKLTNIKKINLNGLNNIESIGTYFMYNNNTLKTLYLPVLPNLKSIAYAFLKNCGELKNINLNTPNLTSINDEFLCNCSSLEQFDFSLLPNLKTIGTNFCAHTTNLNSADLSSWTKLESINNHFFYNSGIQYIKFPDIILNTTGLPAAFLMDCRNIKTVDLNIFSNVTRINEKFLGGCVNVTTLDFSCLTKVTYISAQFCQGTINLTKADLSHFTKLETIYTNFFYGCTNLTELDLSGCTALSSISSNFLHSCKNLSKLSLPTRTNLTEVDSYFLYDCASLKTVDLSALSNVKTISTQFMQSCQSLETIDLSPLSKVEKISSFFMQYCNSLTYIDFSPLENIITIDKAFCQNCSKLVNVKFSGLKKLTSIGSNFFYNCQSLTSFSFEGCESVTEIGDSFLALCTKLTELDLTGLKSLNYINSKSCLNNCQKLTKVKTHIIGEWLNNVRKTITELYLINDNLLEGLDAIFTGSYINTNLLIYVKKELLAEYKSTYTELTDRFVGIVSDEDEYAVNESLVGDVVFCKNDGTLVIRREEDTWQKNETPIGIVVIPSSHGVLKNGTGKVKQCGVMSILSATTKNAELGSNSEVSMFYGSSSTDIKDKSDDLGRYDSINDGLINYTKVNHVGSNGNVNETLQGTADYGYLPSDIDVFNTKIPNTYDNKTTYYHNDNNYRYIPSPYKNDGSYNSIYGQTETPGSPLNALSDFSGIVNTKILTDLAISQDDWKTAEWITHSYDNGYYPAACCCARFKTSGTKSFIECSHEELNEGAGFWYMPACGEFGYVIVRLKEINDVINKLKNTYNIGVQLSETDSYWTSTEHDGSCAHRISTLNGMVTGYGTKYSSNRVRAFMRLSEKYEYVDMGLSVDWATCNIGATRPEGYGYYFQWAGTTAYGADRKPIEGGSAANFGWNSNCPYWVSDTEVSSKWTKYTATDDYSSTGIADNKLSIESIDDAVRVQLGDEWRMPTKEEYQELIDACNIKWVEDYNGTGIKGRLFTLKTDSSKTLFFPAAGYLHGTFQVSKNAIGDYWASSLDSSNSYKGAHLGFHQNSCYTDYHDRYLGFSLRAVKVKPKEYEFMDLGLSVDWATCNIGADKPEEYGWYFQWGGIIPYNSDRTPIDGGDAIDFNFNSNCPYWVSGTSANSTKWSKYTATAGYSSTDIADNKLSLEQEDDAAHVHLGDNCRIPSETEFNELINACNTEWVTNYNGTGINGQLFTLKSNSTKVLFFPTSGYLHGSSWDNIGSEGYYWLSSLYSSYSSYGRYLGIRNCSMNSSYRFSGFPIRAVRTKPKEYDYVDLGLSVDWAACNVGANSPEEYGWYFQWAGTTPYNTKCESVTTGEVVNIGTNTNCPYWESGTNTDTTKWTKYTDADNKLVLDPEDDAAHVHMRGDWRMPTEDEFNELLNKCTQTYVDNYNDTGKNGYLFTSRTDPSKSIFFPILGYVYGFDHRYSSERGYYWSCTLATNKRRAIQFGIYKTNIPNTLNDDRFYGQGVRAVRRKKS